MLEEASRRASDIGESMKDASPHEEKNGDDSNRFFCFQSIKSILSGLDELPNWDDCLYEDKEKCLHIDFETHEGPETDEECDNKRLIKIGSVAIAGNELITKNNSKKLDLDSIEGQNACGRYLSELEELIEVLNAPCASRTYRQHFAQTYQTLYKEGSLSYLTEILDSAQEG